MCDRHSRKRTTANSTYLVHFSSCQASTCACDGLVSLAKPIVRLIGDEFNTFPRSVENTASSSRCVAHSAMVGSRKDASCWSFPLLKLKSDGLGITGTSSLVSA